MSPCHLGKQNASNKKATKPAPKTGGFEVFGLSNGRTREIGFPVACSKTPKRISSKDTTKKAWQGLEPPDPAGGERVLASLTQRTVAFPRVAVTIRGKRGAPFLTPVDSLKPFNKSSRVSYSFQTCSLLAVLVCDS